MTKQVLIDIEDVFVLRGKCDLNAAINYFAKKNTPSLSVKELDIFREGCEYFYELLLDFIHAQPEVKDEKSIDY